jgi:MFS family permease
MVAAVAGVSQLPSLVLSIFGGVIADRFNRKKILLISEASNFIVLVLLALLVATDAIQVWHLLVLGLFNGVTFSLAFPARAAIVPSLVPRQDIANAVALSSIMFSGAQLVGPAVVGVLLAIYVPSVAFFAAAGAVALAIPFFLALKLRRAEWEDDWQHGSVLASILEGVSYIRSHSIVMGLMVMGLVVVVLGMPYQTFLPVFAEEVLDVGPQGLGWLAAAGGVGAIAGSLAIATFSSLNQMKVFLAAGAIGLGVFITLFALSPIFLLSLLFALGAGFFFQIVMTANFALIQVIVPDHLRGRVLSVRFIVFGLSPAGIFALGIAAEQMGTPPATAIVGVLCLVGGALTLAIFPSLRSREPTTGTDVAAPEEQAASPTAP